MIRMFCRGLRPVWVAAFLVALAVIPALAAAPNSPQPQATQTTLLVNTRDLNGRTQATFFVAVTGADGLPATGSIAITDHGKPLAGFILDVQGQAASTVELAPGDHDLSALYQGDSGHLSSRSQVSPVRATASGAPGFAVTVSPATLSLVQGQSGSAIVSVTPSNAASLTAPMFVTISCSGLPDQSACTFTPENIEIPIGATAAINSSMVIATQSGTLTYGKAVVHRDARPIAWAMLPGALALVGLAFSVRQRRLLSRMVLLALLGLITVLGATACSPLYNYHNHGPPHNLPTPAGNFTITVAAQSSNGVTATTETTTIALTVTQ